MCEESKDDDQEGVLLSETTSFIQSANHAVRIQPFCGPGPVPGTVADGICHFLLKTLLPG